MSLLLVCLGLAQKLCSHQPGVQNQQALVFHEKVSIHPLHTTCSLPGNSKSELVDLMKHYWCKSKSG